MGDKYKLFLPIVILFLSLSVHAQCPDMGKPKLDINFKYGKIFYVNDKSSKDFPGEPYSSVMGLTVTNLKNKASASIKMQQIGKNSYCFLLSKLNIEIGFPRIDIYIDKKYRPGSCNYKVIKEHENYHARVHQEGLKFFSKKIEEAYKIALNKLRPVEFRSEDGAQQISLQMIKQVGEEVQPLLYYVQKRLTEENLVIDTSSSYEAESKRCPNW